MAVVSVIAVLVTAIYDHWNQWGSVVNQWGSVVLKCGRIAIIIIAILAFVGLIYAACHWIGSCVVRFLNTYDADKPPRPSAWRQMMEAFVRRNPRMYRYISLALKWLVALILVVWGACGSILMAISWPLRFYVTKYHPNSPPDKPIY